MNDDIKNILVIIARKLNKSHKLLSDQAFEDFLLDMETCTLDDLYRYACDFLNITLTSGAGLKSEFEKIYDILLPYCLSARKTVSSSDSITKRYFMDSKFISFLDGNFEKDTQNSELNIPKRNILMPIMEKDDVLQDLYELGADITEDERQGKTLVSFDDILVVNIYYYEASENGSIKIRCGIRPKGPSEVVIPKDIIWLCYKSLNEFARVETHEMMYINCINRGKAVDFIEAMNLRGKISMKKISQIRAKMNYNKVDVKEAQKDGLQKTS